MLSLVFLQGMDLDEFPPLLSLGFSSPTVDHEEPLSFGTLLASLNMALSNLGPVSFIAFLVYCQTENKLDDFPL